VLPIAVLPIAVLPIAVLPIAVLPIAVLPIAVLPIAVLPTKKKSPRRLKQGDFFPIIWTLKANKRQGRQQLQLTP
jgi:hypothetical protein